MSCPMCDLGISICGEVREGDGFMAEHYIGNKHIEKRMNDETYKSRKKR